MFMFFVASPAMLDKTHKNDPIRPDQKDPFCQLKVVCFSNLLYASLLSPSLSTITQPAFEIGQQAASLICNAIERDTFIKNERIICPSKLDVRESTSTAALCS
jgi:DNA-binding LacI/PurR family transcriptional regulator